MAQVAIGVHCVLWGVVLALSLIHLSADRHRANLSGNAAASTVERLILAAGQWSHAHLFLAASLEMMDYRALYEMHGWDNRYLAFALSQYLFYQLVRAWAFQKIGRNGQ